MSMKVGKGRGRFPMQDEHENGNNGVGMARPGASAHEECRGPEPGTDPGVSPIEPTDRVRGMRTEGEIRLGGGCAASAELWQVEQGGAGCSASLRGKSNGDERGADDATDPRVSGPRGGEGSALPTASVSG